MLRGCTELHVHSEYSMRDGANKVEKLLLFLLLTGSVQYIWI